MSVKESRPDISIVIPVYNSENTLPPLIERIRTVLEEVNQTFEIVCVNDCSIDGSWGMLKKLHAEHDWLTIINLTRNFGEHNAVLAGLHNVHGRYTIIMDDDGQNRPEDLPKLISRAQETSCDVVYTSYPHKKHHWFRNLGSAFTNYCASYLIGKPRGLYLSSFKLITADIVSHITRYTGGFPYIDGLIFSFTRTIATVDVQHTERHTGQSNYNITKLMSLWFNMAFNFSLLPLRISIIFGMLILSFSLCYTVIIVIEKTCFNPHLPMGYPSLILLISFLAGSNLLLLGIIGEYIGRILFNTNNRPQFSIRKKYGNKFLQK